MADHGYSLRPHLCCLAAAKALAFYQTALGAEEVMRVDMPDGRLGHAELRVGDVLFYLSDEYPEIDVRSPQSIGGTAVSLCLQVPDVDASVARMEAAGARVLMPVSDRFYGERRGKLVDPFGHTWVLSTVTETLSREEIEARAKAMGNDCADE